MQSNSDALIRKLESIGELSDDDRQAIAALPLRVKSLRMDEDAVRDGDVPSECCLLIDGFMHRYKVLPDGKRQILAFHTPGDIPDLQSLHLTTMDHSLAATISSHVAFIPHDAIRKLIRRAPKTGDLLWRDTLIDAAIFRAWIVGLGQRSARGHLAHLMCEMFLRLKAIGLADGNTCKLPLTQGDLGDALGLSTVHVNRTLQELRGEGLIEFHGGRLKILDWPLLKQAAQFDPTYLQLRDARLAA
jgi:CRP-like cAMP-binding protein